MKFTNEIINTIKQFAIDNVEKHPNDIVCLLCSHFGITKPTAKKYMDELVADKIVAPPKKGRYPAYHLMTAAWPPRSAGGRAHRNQSSPACSGLHPARCS